MAKKDVILDVDGKPVILKLGFNGLIDLEETIGKPIAELTDGEVSFTDIRTIFHIAIRHGGKKDITVEGAGDILDTLLDNHGMDYIAGKIGELFENMMGGQGDSFPTS